MKRVSAFWVTYLQVAPLTLVIILGIFLVVPIATIIVVSFFDYNEYDADHPGVRAADHYRGRCSTSPVTWRTYLADRRVRYADHRLGAHSGRSVSRSPTSLPSMSAVRLTWQTVLFLVCTIPFLDQRTSSA